MMLSGVRRCAVTAGMVAVVSVGVAPAAYAHEIEGSAAGKGVLGFVWLGFEHMLLGWDHLLFIGGVVLLAGQVRRAAQLISVFVLGHSTTLIVATMAGWRVSPVLVDVVIAVSLVFVGGVGLVGRPRRWRLFAVAVLGFGLVHGLGLSTRLQDLGLPQRGLLVRVIGFNVGIELGQLLAIAVLVGLVTLVSRLVARSRDELTFQRVAHGGLVAAALAFAVPLAVLAPAASGGIRAEAIGSCRVAAVDQPLSTAGGHPESEFFGPDEVAPEDDFAHVIGDGFVVIRYSLAVFPEQVARLRTFLTGSDGDRLVAGAAPEQTEPLKAVAAHHLLTCAEFDMPALVEFAKAWFTDPRSRPTG